MNQSDLAHILVNGRSVALEFEFCCAGFGNTVNWLQSSTNRSRCRRASRTSESCSKHLEIFAVLPVGDLGLEAFDLSVLDVRVVVDELRAQRLPEERVVLQRIDRLTQGLRQQCRLGLVGRVR